MAKNHNHMTKTELLQTIEEELDTLVCLKAAESKVIELEKCQDLSKAELIKKRNEIIKKRHQVEIDRDRRNSIALLKKTLKEKGIEIDIAFNRYREDCDYMKVYIDGNLIHHGNTEDLQTIEKENFHGFADDKNNK